MQDANSRSSRLPRFRAGVDVGGTFTDVLIHDETTGSFTVSKTLTTPDDPSNGIVAALTACLTQAGVGPGALERLIHGTTLVTNALILRTGAPTALVTTRGFRDVLDIAREHRYDMYDLLLELPRPLVPREHRYEIDERCLADGTIYRSLRPEEIDRVAGLLDAEAIRAVAIVFLHSFRNPAHERIVAARLQELLPKLRISVSSDVAGEIREYERASTTIVNAYVQEILDQYLESLETRLNAVGFRGRLLVMLSNGGLATVDTARRYPVRVIESGPAAGAIAAAQMGRLSGRSELLSFDMGGTTAKACLIDRGAPFVTHEFEVDRVDRFKVGSGLPIKAPAIDMIEIGAGGGSIARVDRFGLVKVGPESAGAVPGPASYGQGGRRPTVTDADLVLGYLDPAYFLGGSMRLNVGAASEALGEHIASPLDLSVAEAAWAVHRIVNENMASAARIHAVERGKDVRRYPIFAFGGAGPVHAYRVAEILGIDEIIVPFAAGVGSTVGFLVAPISFDFVRGAAGPIERLDWREVAGIYQEMEAAGCSLLIDARVEPAEIEFSRTCDMRLAGQAHEISVRVPAGALSDASAIDLQAAFDETYLALYKRAAPGVSAEALNWRLNVRGPRSDVRPPRPGGNSDATSAIKGDRPAYLPEKRDFVEIVVYDRYRLGSDSSFRGPAIVEERESTIVIGPHGRCTVDEWGNVVIRIGRE
jgi:N-methylhydantoinase A